MTGEQLEKMSDWLREQQRKLERDEPYAKQTIDALRRAADFVDASR